MVLDLLNGTRRPEKPCFLLCFLLVMDNKEIFCLKSGTLHKETLPDYYK